MKRILGVIFALCMAAVAGAQPEITSLSAASLPRSGRLIVQGTNFGKTQADGLLLIGGLTAPTTRWSDTSVTAYVPEATAIGTAMVQVVTAAGASNEVPLDVTLRPAPQGHVLWRFQADSDYIFQRPAVGLDGTVVAHDSAGFVYALSPDGGLKWIFKTPVFAYGPPSIGSDGTAYVASIGTIYAINPDGTQKWSYTEPPGGQGVMAGPTVGPDGNIYAVTDQGGQGVIALSPTGQLLWSNLGDPNVAEVAQLGAEIVFGPSQPGGAVDQLYVTFNDFGSAPHDHAYAFTLTGQQVWTDDIFASEDSFMQHQAQPRVGPDGTLFISAVFPTGGSWSLNWVNPANGVVESSFFPTPSPVQGISAPEIGSDGMIYIVHSLGHLDAVSPAGSLQWEFFDGSIVNTPVVGPANNIVIAGGASNFGVPGHVRAYNPANGALLWTVDLGVVNGGNQVPESQLRLAPDGSAVYVGTAILGAAPGDTFCYLYALDSTVTSGPPTVVSITLVPSSVNGGDPSAGTVTLSGPAPAGGATVNLSSSNTAAATVPATVLVAEGTSSATFTVSTSSVTQDTSVLIAGAYNSSSQSAILIVRAAPPAPTVQSLALAPSSVNGGDPSTGTVTLSGPAPAGGATVNLSSSDTTVATVPATVLVAQGTNSATFTVSTSSVPSDTSATITAAYNSSSQSAILTVLAVVPPPPPCSYFCDNFEDNDDSGWTFSGRGVWDPSSSDLEATTTRKALAVSPDFTAPAVRTVDAHLKIQTAGGRASVFGWYVDKTHYVEVRLMQDKGKILLKQKQGTLTSKGNYKTALQVGQSYHVSISFDGISFKLFFDDSASPVLTRNAVGSPQGRTAFEVRSTTGMPASAAMSDIAVN